MNFMVDYCAKTVLVTGGASGIGRNISLKFAQEGWQVLCHYCCSSEDARGVKDEIEENAGKCITIQADLSVVDELENFIQRTNNYNIHSLVNNAGSYGQHRHFSELSEKDLMETFRVNVFAPLQVASELFLKMKSTNWGRIVNVSSIAAKYGGSAYSMHYGCSKRALEGVTKTLAREGAQFNVLVNTVRPGVIDTDFHKKFPKDMKERVAMIPLKRMGTSTEVAEVAYFLGSERNTFITNEIITISGGE